MNFIPPNFINRYRIHFNDGFVSLFFHGLKSLVVLYINWIVLNKLPNKDYVEWSITSSILMIATASDLGIGQHTVTLLIHSKKELRKNILFNSCVAITPLFLLSFIFVFLSLSGQKYYVFLMAFFVSLRLFSIPFGALLNATNNFKTRKIIEFVTYVFAAISISIILLYRKDVYLSLLSLNISFILGSIITILATLKYLPQNIFVRDISIFQTTTKVFLGSLPYLVNNLTALLTYGGFIWFSSFVLPDISIGKLAVLHSFLFMTLYQVYDVFLRSKQADLILPLKITFLLKLNKYIILFACIFLILAGKYFLKFIAPGMIFTITEIIYFSLFVLVEFFYLIIQSIVQVDNVQSRNLFFYSIVRILAIIAAFIIFYFFIHVKSLSYFLCLLSLCSFIGLLFSNYHFKLKTNYSIWR